MKKLSLLFILISSIAYGQDFIRPKEGEIIKCKITSVDYDYIRYYTEDDGNDKIEIKNVAVYTKDGKSYNVELNEKSPDATNKLMGILPLLDGKVVYSDVIKLDSISKNEIYTRVKSWIFDAYKSSKAVTELDDKENGKVFLKGIIPAYWEATFISGVETKVEHSFKILIKDGKLKYEISNLVVSYWTEPSQYTKATHLTLNIEDFGKNRPDNTAKYFNSINKKIEGLIASLKATAAKKSDEDF